MTEQTKIITASAGTGKTYRLSLEYISILLTNPEVDFSEIVVITFTKKATYEIREKVFEHFKTLFAKDSNERQNLIKNLEDISGINITPIKLKSLEKTYHNILKNKAKLNIKTNDSFIHSIFSRVIAPFLQIDDFSIDNNINDSYLPEIWDVVLNSEGWEILKKLFPYKISRNIDEYNSFIKSIIDNLWIFEIQTPQFTETSQKETELFAECSKYFCELIDMIYQIFKYKNVDKHFGKWIKNDFNKIFELNENLTSEEYYNRIKSSFNQKFIEENFKIFLKKEIWNGNKLRAKSFSQDKIDLANLHCKFVEQLKIFLYLKVLLPEMENIYKLSQIVKTKYDEIKFRDKIFTYNDLQLYSYRVLYDEELSLIDNGNVTNEFYFRLSSKIRYLLFDEFQDTSIIQWKIFFPIISEIMSGEGVKNYGKCVIVGDEKQSIYRWRGGESDLITNLPNQFQIESERLSTSYRSEKNIIDFVNTIFSVISRNFEGKWKYEDVACHKKGKGFVNAEITSIKDFPNKKYQFYKQEIEKKLIENIKNKKINPAKTAILARKNSTLLTIGSILEENGIDYYLQSPHTVFQNAAIRPIIIALKYLSEPNPVNLLKLLRSDFVAIYPDEIAEVFDKLSPKNNEDFKLNDIISKLKPEVRQSIEEISNQDFILIETIENICRIFNWKGIFKDESSAKNLFYFLEIAAKFSNSTKAENNSVTGFLNFIKENIDNVNYKEKGLESVNAIQLLSIHRSKGLQFETVFVFWDFSERENHSNSLKTYLRFNSNFTEINEMILTYSNNIIAKELDIYKEIEIKEKKEKLNLFYVAVTRAEKNLFLCISYNNYIEKLKDLEGVNSAIYNAIDECKPQSTDNKISYEIGDLISLPTEKTPEETADSNFSISLFRKINKIYENNITEEDLKKEYLSERKQMKGIIVHYFLSKIKYATEDEIRDAEKSTLNFFANIIHRKMIAELIMKSKKFIKENHDIFSSKWDKILNEYPIFITSEMREKFPELSKKEYRIDRMMIDFKNKIIEIIDYKTGSIHDDLQVENYIKIVEAIDFVKNDGFKVKGRYCKLEL